MFCNDSSKTIACRTPSPVTISNNAVIELDAPITPVQHQQGFIIINLEGRAPLYLDGPEKELLVK